MSTKTFKKSHDKLSLARFFVAYWDVPSYPTCELLIPTSSVPIVSFAYGIACLGPVVPASGRAKVHGGRAPPFCLTTIEAFEDAEIRPGLPRDVAFLP